METQDLQRIKNRYDIIGNDPALNRAIETAVAVAPTDLTVLITGESGVGKDSIPRIIHQTSLRKNGKFFALNCGGIPEGTINSELFGHEKGSFTGAIGERKGYFEEADGGTLFLDEISEMPLATQAMLLRVLQNGEFIKVGSSKVEKTDVRVIAASNKNLLHAVSQGKFREDLYYRLCGIQINMPSLRERKDDIYLLFRKFTSDFSEKYRVCKINLTHDAIALLRSYRWPGNIRQLKNVAEAVSAMESSQLTPGTERCEIPVQTLAKYIPKDEETVLPAVFKEQSALNEDEKEMIIKAILDLKQDVEALKAAVFNGNTAKQLQTGPDRENTPEPEPQEAEWQDAESELTIEKASDALIRKALEKHNGNRKLAADELGISERTLYRRLSKITKD